ncbi:MAG: glycosyltransferase family A protein [Acidobacteriota bacterium]
MDLFLSSQLDRIREWHVDPTAGLIVTLVYAAVFATIFIRSRLHFLALPELAECAPQPQAPDCMVVIPARNEADVIGRLVRSLPPDTVIVVDDESTDKTAAEAEEAGAGVLKIPAKPRGAIGKPFACSVGARAIRSKWILFVDADTWYEDGIIESIIYAAEANNLSFVSIHLKIEPESFAELLLARMRGRCSSRGSIRASVRKGRFTGAACWCVARRTNLLGATGRILRS